MASFEELLNAAEPPKSAADVTKAVDLVLSAEDAPDIQKTAMVTGYLLGITFAAGCYQDGDPTPIAGEIMQRLLWMENNR